jgi:excinuclease ABC subunit C
VISLAKPDEFLGEKCDKIYIPGRKNAIRLGADHPLLFLMMRIRDEAHRRAVTYHRNLRSKGLTRSVLDGIPGVGKQRKKHLLQYFKTIDGISKAKVEELCAVPGINRDLAIKIVDRLSKHHAEEKGGQPQIYEKAQNIV